MYLATYLKSATVYPSRRLWAIMFLHQCSVLHTATIYEALCWSQIDKDDISQMTFSNIFELWNADFGQLVVIHLFSLGSKVEPFWIIWKTDFYQSCHFCRKMCNNKCVYSMSHWRRRLKLFALYIIDNIKPVFQNNFLHGYTRHQSSSIFQGSTHEKEGLYNLQLSVLLIGIPHWHQKDTRAPWESQTCNIQLLLLLFFYTLKSWIILRLVST